MKNNKECKVLEFKRKDVLDLIDISGRQLSEEEMDLMEEKEAIQKAKRINEKIFRAAFMFTGLSVLLMAYMFISGLTQFDLETIRLSLYGTVFAMAIFAVIYGMRNVSRSELFDKENEINRMLRNACRG